MLALALPAAASARPLHVLLAKQVRSIAAASPVSATGAGSAHPDYDLSCTQVCDGALLRIAETGGLLPNWAMHMAALDVSVP